MRWCRRWWRGTGCEPSDGRSAPYSPRSWSPLRERASAGAERIDVGAEFGVEHGGEPGDEGVGQVVAVSVDEDVADHHRATVVDAEPGARVDGAKTAFGGD